MPDKLAALPWGDGLTPRDYSALRATILNPGDKYAPQSNGLRSVCNEQRSYRVYSMIEICD